jgi:hypothetical protein
MTEESIDTEIEQVTYLEHVLRFRIDHRCCDVVKSRTP